MLILVFFLQTIINFLLSINFIKKTIAESLNTVSNSVYLDNIYSNSYNHFYLFVKNLFFSILLQIQILADQLLRKLYRSPYQLKQLPLCLTILFGQFYARA